MTIGEIKKKIAQKLSIAISARARSVVFVDLISGYAVDSSSELKGVYIRGRVNIGRNCKIMNGVTITGRSTVSIGDNTSLSGPNTDIMSKINPVSIGKFCSIARGVNFQEYNHAVYRPSTYFMEQNVFGKSQVTDIYSNGPIEIGNDVWIGAQCVVLGGAKVGNGAIIAANSVVNGNIPPYAIAGGSPAQVIKYRFDADIIARLEAIAWWNWSFERMKLNESFFMTQVTHSSLDAIQ